MKSFSESLLKEIDNQLEELDAITMSPIQGAEQAYNILHPAYQKLKKEYLKYKFKSKEEEIIFFKEYKPQLVAKLVYYNQIYNIETSKPLGSKKCIRKYFNSELKKIHAHFNENIEFYKYYRTGNTSHDNSYFLHGKKQLYFTFQNCYFQEDHQFSSPGDYKVAQILANEKIKTYLENEISKLDINTHNKIHSNTTKTLKWTGSKVALIELIYALHTEGVFNNGSSDLKEITRLIEAAFQINLGQFNRSFVEIRARKFERTKFLTTLKEKLILRMDNADEN